MSDRNFTSKHVFVDQLGRKHFQSDKFPQLPPDWVALSLDNMADRKMLSEHYQGTDNQFTRDLKEVLEDKEK